MRRSGFLASALLILVTLLLTAPLTSARFPTGSTTGSSGGAAGAVDPVVAVNISETPSPNDLSPIFWGTTVSPRLPIHPGEGELVNSTPSQIIVWPGGAAGDAYDPINNQIWSPGHPLPKTPPTSEAQFVAWCQSINCSAMMEVPGEIDNPGYAAEIVNYTENTLHFHPAYWIIGNEPQLWTHFDIGWQSWIIPLTRTVTPIQYAWLVRNYTLAMRAVDPTIRIIGIGSTGRPGAYSGPVTTWISDLVALDGPYLSAVSYHSYPTARSSQGATLENFYAAINGTAGFTSGNASGPSRVAQFEQAIALGCLESQNVTYRATGCTNVQLFVTEMGSGLSSSAWGPYSAGFPGALDLAAQVTQAMGENLSTIDLFSSIANTTNSWFSTTGTPRPDYTLYTQIFDRLGPVAFPVSLTTPAEYDGNNTTLGSDLYGVATLDPGLGDRSDLLVVNLNATTSVEFDPSRAGIPATGPTEAWTWNGTVENWVSYYTPNTEVVPSTPAPVGTFYPAGIQGNWTLPPQGLVLLEYYPGGGAPVTFSSQGVVINATNPRWYLEIDGRLETANLTTTLTDFLPTGANEVVGVGVPLPYGGVEREPRERMEPFVGPVVTVGSAPEAIPVPFVEQWRVNITAAPGGEVTPAVAWWNNSASLTLTARDDPTAPGVFQFTRWDGFGAGSSNATSATITLRIDSSFSERALFTELFPVDFNETGLPVGQNWSVLVHTTWNITGTPDATVVEVSSSTATIATDLTNGTHAYEIVPVPGYRTVPLNSSVTVNATRDVVTVGFVPKTPPGEEFPVTFEAEGLPAGTPWSVTVRNVTFTTTGPEVVFAETNGSYGYRIGLVPGWEAHPPAFGFAVAGGPTTVEVDFGPALYEVAWVEEGLGAEPNWTVNVDGVPVSSSGAWVTAHLANGTHSFLIPRDGSYIPHVVTGTFTVDGAAIYIEVPFAQATFDVVFSASGPFSVLGWVVRFSNTTVTVVDQAVDFRMPNGSYTFDVQGPTGYYPVPSHGTVNVTGQSLVVAITFSPSHRFHPPRPDPLVTATAVAATAAATSAAAFVLLRSARRRGPGGRP